MASDGDGGRIAAADQSMLRDLVGTSTIVRALDYATRGAVLSRTWDPDEHRLVGEVRGTAREPYRVSMTVTRTSAGRLADLDGRCTCPVGYNCKHAVALLLASPAPSRPGLRLVGDGRSAVAPAEVPAWERSLRAVLDADVHHREARDGLRDRPAQGLAAVGLQFELIPLRAGAGRSRRATGPGIRIRPVTRSPAGNWVRSEISWAKLEYYGVHTLPEANDTERLALLKEMRALAGLGGRYWGGYSEDPVWLEAIGSRRLWDLLRHVQEAGIPLIGAGRQVAPVTLEAAPVELAVDLSRNETGLQLRPELTVGDRPVAPDAALLIGSPAHGVAWWDAPPSPNATPPLHLAPLSHPLSAAVADLVRGGPVHVPAGDSERFERELFPQLRRVVPFRSGDASIDLPQAAPDLVVLVLAHAEGALQLRWGLRAGSGVLRDLADGPDRAAAAIVTAIVANLAGISGLLDTTPWGPRLVARSALQGMAAARFVTEVLPELAAIDGLVVERDGAIPDYRESDAAPVVHLRSERSTGDWLDLGVEVEVDGEEVPFQELFVALAAGRSHLLLPSGTYFSLDRPELHRLTELIAEARSLQDAPPGRVRLSRYQASLWDDLTEVATVGPQAGAWAEAVRALHDGIGATGDGTGVAALDPPAGLHATLRPYQLDGFRWLAALYEHRLGGILADDMGLGKTLQVLALVSHAKAPAPFLVVAPTSVVGNWISEAHRFTPDLRAVAVTATERRRGSSLALLAATADVVVTSYALFRLESEAYEGVEWAGLVLDEAQFAKNPASHNNQRARRLPVPWKLAVTGTPLENSLQELWALTAITAPGLFARADRFAETYRTPIEKHGDTARLDQLRRRVRPIMLRRTKALVAADLPDKQEQVIELDLHPRHRKLYDLYLQRERQKVLGLLDDLQGNRFEIFRSLTLLRQACLDVALVDPARTGVPSAKLDALTEMLDDVVADGHRVLVFSQFTRFLTMARARASAAGIDVAYLDGSTTDRTTVIDGFRTGTTPVFFISLKAGGFGLNLAEADYCVLLDPWWNPATEAQAVDRVHRIGQTRKVMVYRLVAKDTIEEKVMALKARKSALFASVIDGGGFERAALGAEDVRALLE